MSIVEIECHSKVLEWLTESVDRSVESEFRAYKRFFKDLPENDRVEILFIKCNGQIVGFLGLWRLGMYMEHVASIGVSVHPNYWGEGFATKLIKSAIETAKEKGFKRVEVETLAENVAMRHAAEKSGFMFESIRKKRIQKDGAYHDEVSYYLLL